MRLLLLLSKVQLNFTTAIQETGTIVGLITGGSGSGATCKHATLLTTVIRSSARTGSGDGGGQHCASATECHVMRHRISFVTGHLPSLPRGREVSALDSDAEGLGIISQWRRCRVTVLGKLFTPIVHASFHQAAKLAAALVRVAGVTAGLAESNCSLPPGL